MPRLRQANRPTAPTPRRDSPLTVGAAIRALPFIRADVLAPKQVPVVHDIRRIPASVADRRPLPQCRGLTPPLPWRRIVRDMPTVRP